MQRVTKEFTIKIFIKQTEQETTSDTNKRATYSNEILKSIIQTVLNAGKNTIKTKRCVKKTLSLSEIYYNTPEVNMITKACFTCHT